MQKTTIFIIFIIFIFASFMGTVSLYCDETFTDEEILEMDTEEIEEKKKEDEQKEEKKKELLKKIIEKHYEEMTYKRKWYYTIIGFGLNVRIGDLFRINPDGTLFTETTDKVPNVNIFADLFQIPLTKHLKLYYPLISSEGKFPGHHNRIDAGNTNMVGLNLGLRWIPSARHTFSLDYLSRLNLWALIDSAVVGDFFTLQYSGAIFLFRVKGESVIQSINLNISAKYGIMDIRSHGIVEAKMKFGNIKGVYHLLPQVNIDFEYPYIFNAGGVGFKLGYSFSHLMFDKLKEGSETPVEDQYKGSHFSHTIYVYLTYSLGYK